MVSVTTLHAGGVFNVLPNEATAAGTFRAGDDDFVRIKRRVEEVVVGVAATYGCDATVDFTPEGRVPYP